MVSLRTASQGAPSEDDAELEDLRTLAKESCRFHRADSAIRRRAGHEIGSRSVTWPWLGQGREYPLCAARWWFSMVAHAAPGKALCGGALSVRGVGGGA
jgi:hypothetical protein